MVLLKKALKSQILAGQNGYTLYFAESGDAFVKF